MKFDPFRSLKTAWALGVLCLFVTTGGVIWKAWDMYGPLHKPMLQGWDDSFYYYWLPAVVINHNLDFAPLLAHSGTGAAWTRVPGLDQPPHTSMGLFPNKYPLGWALGSLPFFLAANIHAPKGSTGFEPRYLMTVCLGQMLYAALGLWLAIKIIARYFPLLTAFFAVAIGWLASPLIYYQSVRIWLSHSQVFVLAMALFWVALNLWDNKGRYLSWAALGFFAAMLVVTRNLSAVYLVFPALVIVCRLRSPIAAVALLGGFLGPVFLQLLAWKLIYGSWILYTYTGERFDFGHMHLWQIFFSPFHGWFYWHPLLLVGMMGFVFWIPQRAEGWAWTASFAAIAILNAAWWCWWLGSSFGNRGFEVPTFFAMMGLALLIHRSQPFPVWRGMLATICGLAIIWNLLLFTMYLGHRIERQSPVTYSTAARAMVNFAFGIPASEYRTSAP